MFEKNTEQKNFVSEDLNKNTMLKSVKMHLDCYNMRQIIVNEFFFVCRNDSGSCKGNLVEVRVFSSAPFSNGGEKAAMLRHNGS